MKLFIVICQLLGALILASWFIQCAVLVLSL